MSSSNIAIVGGSIAGCSAAIPLLRAGHQVQIFERAKKPLSDRGAGIVIPTSLFDLLVQLDMLSANMARIPLAGMNYVVRSDDMEPLGRTIWQRPLDAVALRWGELFQQLRQRVDNSAYHQGVSVTEIQQRKIGGRAAVG